MDYDHKIELENLIKEDILSKKGDELLDVFLEDYISEDIIDYENATGLRLMWEVVNKVDDNDFDIKVSLV